MLKQSEVSEGDFVVADKDGYGSLARGAGRYHWSKGDEFEVTSKQAF